MDIELYIALISLILLGILTAPFLPSLSSSQVDLNGYSPVEDIQTEENLLVFESGCYQLSMVVSRDQTESIQKGILNFTGSRPLTHDLFASTLSELDTELEAVKIYGLMEGSYLAYLVIEENGEIQRIDSRPSDAVALASRTRSPVYVNEELLREAGEDTCERGGKTL